MRNVTQLRIIPITQFKIMKHTLKGKRALVTGGARGIGLSICKALIENDVKVILTDIDRESGSEIASRIGAEFHFLDVTDRQQFIELFKRYAAQNQPIDILVNNAGFMRVGSFTSLTEQEERDLLNVNLLGVVNGVHAALPLMKKNNKGCIVNIGSLAGEVAMPFGAIYSSAKFGVTALGDALNLELRDSDINVCTVFPAMVKTELIAGISPPRFPRTITAEHVASAVINGIKKGKQRVYAPKSGVFFGKLPSLLPNFLVNVLASVSGANTIFKTVDSGERLKYSSRIQSNNLQ